MRFPVQEATVRVHEAALEIEAAHGLAYWDSAIVAAARALGCQELHTEDLDHGRQIGGVTVINPFR
jgi:Predicted nucleic-acid-binding protein, contains PIN domain